MGRLGSVLTFTRTTADGDEVAEVVLDFGGDDRATAAVFAPAGVDAPPLPDDYVAALETDGSGEVAAVGFLDPANEGQAVPGEYRVYSRDENGAVVASVHLRADGSVVVANGSGSFKLTAGGQFDANGNFTVDP